MPFFHTNVAEGLPANAEFQVGRTDIDGDLTIEQDIFLPGIGASQQSPGPSASYVYYDCTVGVVLDSGIVVHNRLPQYRTPFVDTLAVIPFDDPRLDTLTGFGVNLTSRDQYVDIVQRMGHSRYWFRLWGKALRVGYQIPIPGIKSIAGALAIPYDKNPQWAYNKIAPGGNYSGAILWQAEWSLWYTTNIPPGISGERYLVSDPSAHISGSAASSPPPNVQAPFSQADDNALPTGGPSQSGGGGGGSFQTGGERR